MGRKKGEDDDDLLDDEAAEKALNGEDRDEDDEDHDDDHDEDEDEEEGSEGKKKEQKEDDSDEEEPDERAVKSDESTEDDDAEREAIRERRRAERKARKEAQRAREDNLRHELAARDTVINDLQTRLAAMEQSGTRNEIQQIDSALQQLGNIYVGLKQQLEEGTTKQNGQAVADATEKMLQVRQRAEQLVNAKNQIIQRAQHPRQVPPDPRVTNYGQQWMSRHSWFKQGSRDSDSLVVSALDDALASEGVLNPSQKEYWDELSVRVRRALPHRFTSQDPSNKIRVKPRQVIAGSSRSSSGNSNGGFSLSAERVQAIKDAGRWNDPKQRQEMINEYKKYDREHRQGKE